MPDHLPEHRRLAPPVVPTHANLPVRPPDSPWSNRIDLAFDTASPCGVAGHELDRWLSPTDDADRHRAINARILAIAGGRSRVDNPHLDGAPWTQHVVTGRTGLELPRILLGDDLAIESSRLFVHRPDEPATVPVHQDVPEQGLLDPRFALTALYLLAHEGFEPFARTSPHTHADGFMPHEPTDAGAFEELPRLDRADGRRWWTARIPLVPGDVLCTDLRTLRTFGTDAPWMALTVRWITPAAVIRRVADAPPIQRVRGDFVAWNTPSALARARARLKRADHSRTPPIA